MHAAETVTAMETTASMGQHCGIHLAIMELSMFQVKWQGCHCNPPDASVQHPGHRVVVEENECTMQHLCRPEVEDVTLFY